MGHGGERRCDDAIGHTSTSCWAGRCSLATIGAYVVIGPYITLGWIAKGIELAIIGLVAVDLLVGLTIGSWVRPPSLLGARGRPCLSR